MSSYTVVPLPAMKFLGLVWLGFLLGFGLEGFGLGWLALSLGFFFGSSWLLPRLSSEDVSLKASPSRELEWLMTKGILIQRAETSGEVRHTISSQFKRELAKHLSALEETEYDPSEVLNKAVLKALVNAAGGGSAEDNERFFVRMNLMLTLLPTNSILKRITDDMEEIHRAKVDAEWR